MARRSGGTKLIYARRVQEDQPVRQAVLVDQPDSFRFVIRWLGRTGTILLILSLSPVDGDRGLVLPYHCAGSSSVGRRAG